MPTTASALTEDAPVLIACDGKELARLAIDAAVRLAPDRRAVVAVVWTPAAHFRPGDAVGSYHGIPASTTEALDEAASRRAPLLLVPGPAAQVRHETSVPTQGVEVPA